MSLAKFTFIALAAALLAGCASPPEPPQPSGERIAINPPPVKQPLLRPGVVDDLPGDTPVLAAAMPAATVSQDAVSATATDPNEFVHRINFRK